MKAASIDRWSAETGLAMRWVPNSAVGTACLRDLRCVLRSLDGPSRCQLEVAPV